jgi:hypothetical protein
MEKGRQGIQMIKRTIATAITILLVSAIIITLVPLQEVIAHSPPWTTTVYAYVSVAPQPRVGVGQTVLVVAWLDSIQVSNNNPWTFNVHITKPDNTTETLPTLKSDSTGSAAVSYTPTQIGTYKFVNEFPGLTMPSNVATIGNDTYPAATSEPVYLNVTQEPLQSFVETPLPTDYWQRPVNDLNRQWSSILGNWPCWQTGAMKVGAGNYVNAYCEGPETAHVLWTKQYYEGGVADGRFGDIGVYQGMAYEKYGLYPPIILNGKLYYNQEFAPRRGWLCVDLYTGETAYYHDTSGNITGSSSEPFGYRNQTLAYGQILNIATPNQYGALYYLWDNGGTTTVRHGGIMNPGTTWSMYDAYTGEYICSVANVSTTGTMITDNIGSICIYNIVNIGNATNPNYRLTCWNTTRAIGGGSAAQWRPLAQGASKTSTNVWDGRNGFSLNFSIPAVQGTIQAIRVDDKIIGGTAGSNDGTNVVQGNFWALSLKAGEEGKLLWNTTFTPPSTYPGNWTWTLQSVDPEDDVFILSSAQLRIYKCYSLSTGTLMWTSAPEAQWNYYGMNTNIYKGRLLSYGYGGIMMAYNISTGAVMWNYTSQSIGFESYYGYTPISGLIIADDKGYIVSGEHSPNEPLRRDAMLRCVDLNTGQELWTLSDWDGAYRPAIADGYIVTLNCYDQNIYCIGKGPSATTISASPAVSINGDQVLITGNVTDQSPGAKGTPTISDEYQTQWMQYLYMQQSIPADAKGVEVSLDAIDPNGNYKHIDTVTSDISGGFKKLWTPEVPGEYTITATFAGSKAYGSSYAQTYIGVSDAKATTSLPEYPQPIDNTMTIAGVGAILLIAIIIGFAALMVLLRKRP